jgi:hypothetical protein
MKMLSLVICLALALCSCKKSEPEAEKKTAAVTTPKKVEVKEKAKTPPSQVDPAPPTVVDSGKLSKVTMDLKDFGMKIDVPEGSKIYHVAKINGVRIKGPDISLFIEPVTDRNHKTLEQILSMAKEKHDPKKITTDKLPGGWALTYINKDKKGKTYYVKVFREIEKRSYWCQSAGPSAKTRSSALDACNSLRK